MMNKKTDIRSSVIRYSAACVLFLIIGLRFMSMSDDIGTAIYSTSSAFCLLAALNLYRQELTSSRANNK